MDEYEKGAKQRLFLSLSYGGGIDVNDYVAQLSQLSIEEVVIELESQKGKVINSKQLEKLLLRYGGDRVFWNLFCYIYDHYKLTASAKANGLKLAWTMGRADMRAYSLFLEISSKLMMDKSEKEKYSELQDEITIYRGGNKVEGEDSNFGLSWTYNRGVAEFFAFRGRTHSIEDGRLFSVTIPKEKIHAIFLDRNEDEVIYFCKEEDEVTIITETPSPYFYEYLKSNNK